MLNLEQLIKPNEDVSVLNNIRLSDEQQEVLNNIIEFINNKNEINCTLTGSAGTGKSTLISFIINYLEKNKIKYCLCAPTHKAALVMKRYSNREAMTLHSLLALSPNLDVLQLDFNELTFNSGVCRSFPYNGVVICDEASMINDDLFKFILERCEEFNSKIIYCGDIAQCSPVKQDWKSQVFKIKNCFNLTKIFRQENESALTPILVELRKHLISKFDTIEKEKGSIFTTHDINEFKEKFIKEFAIAIRRRDVLRTKIASYTNDRVFAYNRVVHKYLFGDEKQYYKNEFLTCYENIEIDYKKYYNSMDYIITESPKRTDLFIPEVGRLPGIELELYDSLDEDTNTVYILQHNIDKHYFELLARKIENKRQDAVLCKNQKMKAKLWKEYFQIMNSFCSPINLYYDNRLIRKKTFDYAYASTIHKLQGSNIYNMFIDMKSVFYNYNAEEIRELQYVALSRTRNNAYIYV